MSAATHCCLVTQSEDGVLSDWQWLLRPRGAPRIFCLRIGGHSLFHGKGTLGLSAMGNVFGCVRGPKEECRVDPKKAPLRPESKELKGRRYFQRKKRKSDISGPVEPPDSPGCEAVMREVVGVSREPQNDPGGNVEESQTGMAVEAHLSSQERLSGGICVGEEPVSIFRGSCHQPHKKLTPWISSDSQRSSSAVDRRLHDISTASRVAPAREGVLVKRLMVPQLRRAVSLGAAEHTLPTLRVEETSLEFVCGSEANGRRRRRASSFSGYIHYPVSAKCVSADHKVNL